MEFRALIPNMKKNLEWRHLEGTDRAQSFFRGDFPNSRTEEDSAIGVKMRRIVDFPYPSKRLHSSNFIPKQVISKNQTLRYFWLQ